MATGSYDRLLSWARKNGIRPEVTAPGARTSRNWAISISIDDPVVFRASGQGATIEDAADKVIDSLQTVGVKID